MNTRLSHAAVLFLVMSITGCGGSSEKTGNNQQEPSTTTTTTTATTEPNVVEEPQTVEQRIAEIKLWYAEVQAMGMKNCDVKKRIKMDGLEAPTSPFDQVVKTCNLTGEYELTRGEFSGHEWNYNINMYKKNGTIFFVYMEGSAETTAWEERYYCDKEENVIRFLKKESNMDDPNGKTTEEKLNTQKPKIQEYIQSYLKDIQYVLNTSGTKTMAELLQGKWQAVNDKSNYLVFEKNLRKEIGAGMNAWDEDNYVLSASCTNPTDMGNGLKPEKDRYISCVQSDMCWYIVSVDNNQLTLSYVGRGNTLKYKRMK